MSPLITIGTAQSQPGTITYGTFDAVPLPTGGMDQFPVIIAQGHDADGPVLWLTSNIHGGEYDGIAVIHHLITADLVRNLNGTVIAIPTLSPAGLRTSERSPYYLHGKDPNRLFPSLPELHHVVPRAAVPLALEMAFARLFERIDATADYLIDLHDYGIDAIPFALRDPVFYREARDRPGAMRLQTVVGDMLKALGLTVINEYASDKYLDMDLHRTVSGATLNRARIPAVTIEVGGFRQVNQRYVQACVVGIRNVLCWAEMLPDA
ncbi:MAG: succinylglutamate desuccinylase/aspartoacylase family protein, partial [Anaerolineae bacterium]|nr:succinylglutamate desuccinylase/aspartoacylase family protein [Anaerolineae bacterium]